MKRALPLLLLLACEPNRRNQAEDFARGLADVHRWDPVHQAAGFYAYDELMRLGDDAIAVLIERLTDTTQTRIMEMAHITVPTVGDVGFHMLLRLTGTKAEDFEREGVVILPEIDNPIFGVRFDPGARARVQKKFRDMRR